MSHHQHPPTGTLAELVTRVTHASPLDCYQCGRCAAGCPQNVHDEMDLSPTRMMRLLQLEAAFAGQEQGAQFALRALSADTPWLCAGCQACTTRCPQEVDIAGTMDVLRQEALERKVASKSKRARDVQSLHKSFIANAMKRGRVHELSLVMDYKLRTKHFLQDALLAPGMLRRGKLHIRPGDGVSTSRVSKAADEIKRKEKPQ